MASKKFQEIELVNAAGDKRTATTPAQYAQFTFDGFYIGDDVQIAAAEKVEAPKVEAPKAPAGKPVASGASAPGEKTAGSNPA